MKNKPKLIMPSKIVSMPIVIFFTYTFELFKNHTSSLGDSKFNVKIIEYILSFLYHEEKLEANLLFPPTLKF